MIKDKLKIAAVRAAGWLPDALMTAGAGAVSIGSGRIYEPAGWIVAGLFALAGGWLLARGAK